MGISWSIAVSRRADRVRALLEHVRPHVQEIVVGIDLNGDPDLPAAVAGLADTTVGFTLDEGGPERLWGWLSSLCTQEWILRTDDDEVPGRALLERLPALAADRRFSAYRIPFLCPWPEPGVVLAEPPWSTCWETVLLRNVTGLRRFSGAMHDFGEILGEAEHVEEPVYHLVMLLEDEGRRLARARRYEALRPGLVYGGLPANASYVPEAIGPEPALAPVPAEDLAAIERLLDPPPLPAGGPAPAPPPRTPWEAIDLHNTGRLPRAGAYAARLELAGPVGRVRAGEVHHQPLRVRNLGDEIWLAGLAPERPILLGHRWRDGGGRVVADGRTAFERTIGPGEEALVFARAAAPATPGAYTLEIDLVHEHVRWFDVPLALDVEVDDPVLGLDAELGRYTEVRRLREELEIARAALASREGAARYRAADALARPLDRLRGR